MFVSKDQIYYFAECLFIGVVSGLACEIFTFVTAAVKAAVVRHITDFLSFAVVAAAYFYASVYFRFPSVRAYMPLGAAAGFLLERVSAHKILAKYTEICYNAIVKRLRRAIYDRKKNAKTRIVGNGGRGDNAVYSSRRADISISGVKFKKTRNSKTSAGIRATRKG